MKVLCSLGNRNLRAAPYVLQGLLVPADASDSASLFLRELQLRLALGQHAEAVDIMLPLVSAMLGALEDQACNFLVAAFVATGVTAVLCCAVLCCAVLCCAVLCCAVLCCAALAMLGAHEDQGRTCLVHPPLERMLLPCCAGSS